MQQGRGPIFGGEEATLDAGPDFADGTELDEEPDEELTALAGTEALPGFVLGEDPLQPAGLII